MIYMPDIKGFVKRAFFKMKVCHQDIQWVPHRIRRLLSTHTDEFFFVSDRIQF